MVRCTDYFGQSIVPTSKALPGAEMSRPPLDRDAVWAVIDAQRLDLADLLDSLADAEWERPSLCAGWRVRDVAAHLTFAQARARELIAPAWRARGDFDRMIHDTAVARAHSLPPGRIVESIRAMAGSRRRAPGLSPLEPLIDVLVHGQDIAVPLGRPRVMPVDAAATAATRVWTTPWPLSTAFRPVRARLAGLRLVATDTDWSVGEGAVVEGPMQSLLLLMTGRPTEHDRLTGPGARALAR